MKRIVVLLLVIAVLLSMAIGISKENSVSDEPFTWTGTEEPVLEPKNPYSWGGRLEEPDFIGTGY